MGSNKPIDSMIGNIWENNRPKVIGIDPFTGEMIPVDPDDSRASPLGCPWNDPAPDPYDNHNIQPKINIGGGNRSMPIGPLSGGNILPNFLDKDAEIQRLQDKVRMLEDVIKMKKTKARFK